MLAIGRALMGNPVLLLCDEPSEGLGPLVVNRLGGLFRERAKEGIAILLAEQNLRFALEIAARGYVIEKPDPTPGPGGRLARGRGRRAASGRLTSTPRFGVVRR